MSEGSPGAGAAHRPSLLIGASSMVVGWASAFGPAIARFSSWKREHPSYVRGLTRSPDPRVEPPAIVKVSGGLLAAWCEAEGAVVAKVSAEGEVDAPLLVVPTAYRVALARVPGGARLFAAVPDGLRSIAVDGDGRAEGEPVRHFTEQRSGLMLSAVRLRGEALLVYAYPGDASYGVVVVSGSEGSHVRHGLASGCRSLAVTSAGSRAAVTLGLQGRAPQFGLLGAGGKVVERPHPMFAKGRGPLRFPYPVFTERHWTFVAEDHGELFVQPHEAPQRQAPFELPGCDGPFSVVFFSQHLYIAAAAPDGDAGKLVLVRSAVDGTASQRRTERLELDDADTRRRRRAVRGTLKGVADRFSAGGGYRDAQRKPRLARDADRLRLVDEHGAAELLVLDRADAGFELQIVSSLGPDAESEAPTRSMVRLARWVRDKLTRTAREERSADERWGAELAARIGARCLGVGRAGSSVLLELQLDELLTPAELTRFLRDLRDTQRARQEKTAVP